LRLFVALDLREDIRQAIGEIIARLKPVGRNARWVRPEGMHITLKFIGYTAPEQLEAIRPALAKIRSGGPVEMHFRGIGFFPNERRLRVIWCGIEASANLAPLAAHIERTLEPLGIAPESREFVPHLTLARFNPPARADELVRAATEFESRELGSTRETEFHLFESILRPTGAAYKKLASYSFVQGAA
jgi:RNA 2',3'-cyclic 3'-phosphodiesterase